VRPRSSQAAVDAAALTRLGSLGLVRPSPNALQVVVGTVADQLAGEIRDARRSMTGPVPEVPATSPPAPPLLALASPQGTITISNNMPAIGALVAALGGRANLRTAEAAAGRVRVAVADTSRVNREALLGLGLRGVALPAAGSVHLLTGMALSEAVAVSLTQAIG
jgi:N-acetylglucosamine PTS system EIICBA or EIICB component